MNTEGEIVMAESNSKLVADRAAITRTVTSAAEKRAEEIAAPLEALLFPEGVPDTLTLVGVILAIGALLRRTQAGLEAKDRLLAKELGDDVAAREARDAQRTQTRNTVVGMRTMIEGMFGLAGLVRAGLSAPIPAGNDEVIQLAVSAAEQIELNELGSAEGVTLDRAALAGKLRGAAQAFDLTLELHQDEERETQIARGERDRQAELWLQVYPGVADVLAGLAFMVGRTDIADRVRPTARRRAGEPEPIDLEPTDPRVGDPTE
jgi:hypothetical protein